MLLGLSRVLAGEQLEIGKFYLEESALRQGSTIVQCVKLTDEGGKRLLWFTPDQNPSMSFEDIHYRSVFIEIEHVNIRVDPPSLKGSSSSTGLRAGMFIVSGATPFVLVSSGFRGWTMVDLATGEWSQKLPGQWASFERWQIVRCDNNEEIVLSEYGAEE